MTGGPTLDDALDEARALGFFGPGPVAAGKAHAEGVASVIESVFGGLVPNGLRWVDLGSGGGLPGLVLAQRWPHTIGRLVEANARRAGFLDRWIEALGLSGCVVDGRRAEDVGRDPAVRGQAQLVTARGFGPPAVTAECGAPLLSVGGVLVITAPPTGGERLDSEVRSELCLASVEREELMRGQDVPSLEIYRLEAACPDRYPRRVGIPNKRPLGR